MDKSTQTEEGSSVGIVYKITCNLTGKCYYGSTQQTLAKRKSVHKLESNMASSREIVKNGDWKIETVEEVVLKINWNYYSVKGFTLKTTVTQSIKTDHV